MTLPVTASTRALELCRDRGVEVLLAPLSASGLLQTAASGGVTFASDRRGGYVFPAFLPAFDAAAALARLVSLLGRHHETLAEMVQAMPPMPIRHEEVPTPIEHKGLIMRTLMEQMTEEGADLVLVDGIKVRSGSGLGPRRARSRGPDFARLGRGLRRRLVGRAGHRLRRPPGHRPARHLAIEAGLQAGGALR